MNDRSAKVVLTALGSLCALALGVPVAIVVVRGLRANSPVTLPGLSAAVATSLEAAAVATVIIAIFGIPLAWVLARSAHRGIATGASVAVQVPLALPPLVAGIAILLAIGPNGIAGSVTGSRFVDTFAGLVAAQVFVAAPFAIIVARSAFLDVDPGLLDVASTLGVRGFRRFFVVDVRAASAGIAAGLLLAFLRAFGEYGATSLVAYYPTSLPIYTRTVVDLDLGGALWPAAIAVMIAAAVVIAVALPKPHRRHRLAPPVAISARGTAVEALYVVTSTAVQGSNLVVDVAAHNGSLGIVGPSGSGKTATLLALCGIGRGSSTSVLGNRLVDDTVAIGYVPQGGGIDRRLRVSSQIRLAQRVSDAELAWLCEQFSITGLIDKRGGSLSGGERQRVAIVRALASAPELLVFDEPLSALDTSNRRQVRADIERVRMRFGAAFVLVTHDPDEAVGLCEDLVIIGAGEVIAAGPTAALSTSPPTEAVARALGHSNVVSLFADAHGTATLCGSVLGANLEPGSAICVLIDPRSIGFEPGFRGGDVFEVVSATRTVRGGELVVRSAELSLTIEVNASQLLEPGTTGGVVIAPDGVVRVGDTSAP